MRNTFLLGCAFLLFSFGLNASEADKEHKGLVVRENETSIVCRDANGNEVELRKKPQRTLICYTSFVGLWHLAGGTAVGMVDTMDRKKLPEACRELPTVGSFGNPNAERILALKPDLVLLTVNVEKQRTLQEMLRQRGIQCILLNYENYNDFHELLDLFSRLNGAKIEENEKARKVVADVEALIAKASRLKGPRFLVLAASTNSLNSEKTSSNTSRMASLLGGANACKESESGAKFSLERIIIEDPDVILFTTKVESKELQEKMGTELFANPAWKNLKAAKSGRVVFLPPDLFVFKANERFPESFRQMAKILYPDEKWD